MIIILKPTLNCNLRCRYCYLKESSKRGNAFDVDFAKSILRQVKENLPRYRKIKILWHGGEPLLWGLDNFKEILPYIDNEFHDREYKISIQTNLTLINNDFINLFKKHHVNVSLSLDGPNDIHDSQRQTLRGLGTFDTVLNKIKICTNAGLKLGCITVGTRKHIGRVRELYDLMSELGLDFKFNPIFKGGEAQNNIEELGISPAEYASMVIELFDLWFYDDRSRISSSFFTDIASSIISKKKCTHCLLSYNCQDNIIAVSPSGDVVPCGRFCDEDLIEYSYGNLHSDSLANILATIRTTKTYNRAEYIADSDCCSCHFYNICYGGCMYDGFLKSGDFRSKTFLCGAYKKIFKHITMRLEETGMYKQNN
ncbi:MAG: radical SAM protein [Muribaculaceae bacterium]|nr:radical SAM protein [Muribaculaceae bacterium]